MQLEEFETAEYLSTQFGTNEEKVSARSGDVSISKTSDNRVTPTELLDMRTFQMIDKSGAQFQKGRILALPGGGPEGWQLGVDFPMPNVVPTLTRDGALGIYKATIKAGAKS